MDEVMIKIITDEIQLEYETEEYFCKQYLNISLNDWQNFKIGKLTLGKDVLQKIKALFSDYEWMLIQKVAEQSRFFPEKRNYAVQEFKRLKILIARKWMELPICTVELITKMNQSTSKEIINLKVTLKYGKWGYDDILNFQMPSSVSKHLENSTKGLLELVNHDLIDIYVNQDERIKD